MSEFKIIHDSVHGSVRVDGVFLSLLERPEVQRLHNIHQLGLAHLVFPGANHTRLEHSLGTYFLADKIAESLGLEDNEKLELKAAALLHDIGHPPFSHTLEMVINDLVGRDHMEASRMIMNGNLEVCTSSAKDVLGEMPPISELLQEAGISPERVGKLIVSDEMQRVGQETLAVDDDQAYFGEDKYLQQIVHGPVDADQMDYLLRDAYYTGVAHGAIDIDRILQTVALHHGDLVVERGGVVAVEGMLVARALMYTSVYFHKTVRIAEMMLCKAVEIAGQNDEEIVERLNVDTECSLTEKLLSMDGPPSDIINRLRYRKLYKKALSKRQFDMDDSELEAIAPLTDYEVRKRKEREIADRAGVDVSEVIIDVPSEELMLSEPRIGKTEVPILEDDRIKPLSRYSPLARALQYRNIHDWAIMVSTPDKHIEDVEKAAMKVLFK